MSADQNIFAVVERKPIPVTVFTGFLGAGKTSVILGLLKQLPTDYRVVLLKNEYGDIEVDSLLAKESSIAGVSEILNGCMCCTLVGQIQTAMLEIRDKMNPDRIIIESSGSAFPATLAIQIRQLAPEGFSLDAVATVIDSVNFEGYEDSSPTAKIQAKYTDLLLLNKHELVTERALDFVIDHLFTLNEDTPVIKVSKEAPLSPSLIFGLDTKLFQKGSEETADWEVVSGGKEKATHAEEVETRSVWKGGVKPGSRKDHTEHTHGPGEACEHEHEHERNVADEDNQAQALPLITADQLNPHASWRLATILAVPALILALGIPYWYMTTSIERASLPLSEIDKLDSTSALPLKTPIHLGRWDSQSGKIYDSSGLGDVRSKIETLVSGDEPRGWFLAEIDSAAQVGALQVGVSDAPGGSLPFIDSDTLVVPWASYQSEAHVAGDELSMQALATLIDATIASALPSTPRPLPARAIKYSQNVTLSFVLLNEDASLGGGFAQWDIEEALNDFVHPLLGDLGDIHHFAIESQILHHAPLRFSPQSAQVVAWNDAGVVERNDTIYLVTNEEMKSFVNAEAWTLDSASSRDAVLRFLLFIPAANRRPLHLEGDTHPTSFLIPQVGGVVILNPEQSQGQDKRLLLEEMRPAFGEMLGQLGALLGIPPHTVITQVGGANSVINAWQHENLRRSRTWENYHDASNTLQSLGRVVRKAREMQIPHQVQTDVREAVSALYEARAVGSQAAADSFLKSVIARRHADAAFFNPAMMAMLYFPDEHKYAVYMPLFAPVAVSIVVALLKELKRRRKLRAQVKARQTSSEVVEEMELEAPVDTVSRPSLDAALKKMPFDIYRVKGLVQLRSSNEALDGELHVLNWAFGRSELTPIKSAEVNADMRNATYRFTLMGARGEVKKQARKLAEALEGEFA